MKKSYKKEILKSLKNLSENYSNQSLASHLGIALYEYPNFDNLTDKELAYALSKYELEKELDIQTTAEDIDSIIKDASDLEHILEDDDY